MEAITKYATESDVEFAIVHETSESLLDRVSVYGTTQEYLDDIQKLAQVEVNLLTAALTHIEVCNGGFYQFFHNQTGVVAPEAKTGFAEMGLDEVSNLVRKAMNFFGENYPREQAFRMEKLDAITDGPRDQADPFAALDEEFSRLFNWKEKVFERAMFRHYQNFGKDVE